MFRPGGSCRDLLQQRTGCRRRTEMPGAHCHKAGTDDNGATRLILQGCSGHARTEESWKLFVVVFCFAPSPSFASAVLGLSP